LLTDGYFLGPEVRLTDLSLGCIEPARNVGAGLALPPLSKQGSKAQTTRLTGCFLRKATTECTCLDCRFPANVCANAEAVPHAYTRVADRDESATRGLET